MKIYIHDVTATDLLNDQSAFHEWNTTIGARLKDMDTDVEPVASAFDHWQNLNSEVGFVMVKFRSDPTWRIPKAHVKRINKLLRELELSIVQANCPDRMAKVTSLVQRWCDENNRELNDLHNGLIREFGDKAKHLTAYDAYFHNDLFPTKDIQELARCYVAHTLDLARFDLHGRIFYCFAPDELR